MSPISGCEINHIALRYITINPEHALIPPIKFPDWNLDQRRFVGCQRFSQAGFQLRCAFHAYAPDTEHLCHLRKIRIMKLGADHMAAIFFFLCAEYVAVCVVVKHDSHHIDTVLDGGGHFLTVIQKSTVP